MLLAVFSDSHGNKSRMRRVLAETKPDAVVFLGDGLRDLEAVRRDFPGLPFSAVPGNCDRDSGGYDDSLLLDLAGVRIFAAHGHNHAVKYGFEKFGTSVLCSGAVLGLYGHTHRALCTEAGGLTFFNPGSIGDELHPSCGLIELRDGAFRCRILDCREEAEP